MNRIVGCWHGPSGDFRHRALGSVESGLANLPIARNEMFAALMGRAFQSQRERIGRCCPAWSAKRQGCGRRGCMAGWGGADALWTSSPALYGRGVRCGFIELWDNRPGRTSLRSSVYVRTVVLQGLPSRLSSATTGNEVAAGAGLPAVDLAHFLTGVIPVGWAYV